MRCVCFVLDRCSLDRDMGRVCSNYESRWYYDRQDRQCKHFWYGGCEGNDNRFLSKSECEETCSGSRESAGRRTIIYPK